jgi:hypothetical protein
VLPKFFASKGTYYPNRFTNQVLYAPLKFLQRKPFCIKMRQALYDRWPDWQKTKSSLSRGSSARRDRS